MEVRILVRAAVVVAAFAAHAAAQPATESIVLAGGDPELQIALSEALAPAGMTVIAVGVVPAPGIDTLSTAARGLADRQHATATVWLIAGAADTATLITYDRERDRLLVRALPYALPLDATHAAEVARTARTMLRALRVTPDIDQPPPRVEDAPGIRNASGEPLLAASAIVGVRVGAPDADVGGAVAVIYRPDRLGAMLAAELSPSTDIAVPSFSGTIIDGAIAALGRMPIEVVPRVHVIPHAGLALHIVRLRGTLDTMEKVRTTQFDVAARVGAAATYTLGQNLDVGLAISIDILLDRQRYAAGNAEVLVIPRLQTMIGAIATLRVL